MSFNIDRKWKFQKSAWVWAASLAAVLALALTVSPSVRAQSKAAATGSPDKLALLLTTGLEDPQSLNTVLEYAMAARKSGRLSEVVILADGRGVEILAARMGARPVETARLAKQAKAAGVRFVITESGLRQVDMAKTELDPTPDEVIPDGGARLAQLISQHYEIIHF